MCPTSATLQATVDKAATCHHQLQSHMALVDMVEDEESLATEQAALDQFLHTVEDLGARLQTWIDSADNSKQADELKVLTRRLSHLRKCLTTVGDTIEALASGEVHAPHLKQHNEQLQDYK